MSASILWCLCLTAGCTETPSGSSPSAAVPGSLRRPNIIVIYTDDHGYADLGAQGVDPDIRTPHLDAMAADGVRCTHGYVSAPQCVPSRAGLLTGRYQQRFGVDDNLKGPLPLPEHTIAELLNPAGYVSGQVGKWHLEQLPGRGKSTSGEEEPSETEPTGRHDPYLPHAQGFDEYFCGAMTSYVASHDLTGTPLRDAPDLLTERRFRVDVQTDAALSFIRRHKPDPFFLYLAYFAPHVPLESPEPWFSQTNANLPLERRQALAMIAAMDDGVGRIRALLRELQLEQNTLIFFISDNGAPLMEGAWDGSLNTPLVGEKGMLSDGGVRVPFLVEWPGTLPAGAVYSQPVSSLDVATTALAAAGLPSDEQLDGVDLVPFLSGRETAAPHAELFWRWRSQAAVLSDGWKLIRLGADERYLFDLHSPEGEHRNRLADEPERAAALEGRLIAWDATLHSPGLPTAIQRQDRLFFDSHLGELEPSEETESAR